MIEYPGNNSSSEWGLFVQQHRTYTRADPFDRLMQKVKIGEGDDCWIYQGKARKNGYSCVGAGGKKGTSLYGHVVVYERLVGPVPPKRRLHHICENPICVNPNHLRPTTAREHAHEHGLGVGPCRACGHEDWYIRKDNGTRQCRECKRRRRAAC